MLSMDELTKMFVDNQKEFLSFLKTRLNLFHESNVFFRDLHYGVMAYLKMNGYSNRYSSSEELTRRVVEAYEGMKILVRMDERTWMMNYPSFRKASVKTIAPAKPAATAVKSSGQVAVPAIKVAAQNAAAKSVTVEREVTS